MKFFSGFHIYNFIHDFRQNLSMKQSNYNSWVSSKVIQIFTMISKHYLDCFLA